MTAIHIACASDSNYAPYCATMLDSLLASHPHSEITVHFLHMPDFDKLALRRLREQVELQSAGMIAHCMPDSLVSTLPRMQRIPQIMWLRVWLPRLLPDNERVLYLDVDTLVRDSLETLWATSFGDKLVAAVDNVLEPSVRNRPAELGLRPSQGYFNSGVLLMNLEQMRREDTTQKIVDYARDNASSLIWPDQDALNHVLGERRVRLHPRWNCQNSFFYWRAWSEELFGTEQLDAAVAAPGIIHFEGPAWAKPWHYLSNHPYRNIWCKHQLASAWPPPPLVGRTLKNRVIRCLSPPVLKPVRRLLGIADRPIPVGGPQLP